LPPLIWSKFCHSGNKHPSERCSSKVLLLTFGSNSLSSGFIQQHNNFEYSTTLAGAHAQGPIVCFGRRFSMKQPKWLVSSMLLTAMSLPAQTFGGARVVQSAQPVASPSHYYLETAAKKTVPKRRSKKKSAVIVGGSALGGAAIGGLAGGKKGAAIGALAGGGGGYVYDRKSQKKPVIPK